MQTNPVTGVLLVEMFVPQSEWI